MDEVLFPDAQAVQDTATKPSQHVLDLFTRLNMHAMRLGPGDHLQGRVLMDGAVKPEEVRTFATKQVSASENTQYDYFHELIMTQEMARIHARGYHDGVAGGNSIGLPAVKNFAKPAIRNKVLQEVLDGRKMVALAITEAFAGSDVQGIKTFAKKTPDGQYWEVTGMSRVTIEYLKRADPQEPRFALFPVEH